MKPTAEEVIQILMGALLRLAPKHCPHGSTYLTGCTCMACHADLALTIGAKLLQEAGIDAID